MDASAVNVNVTVDDFDSVLSYPDKSQWQTPDPSSTSFNASGSPWLRGTYHQTDVVGASVSFNFTGPAVFIYGYGGPSYGSYQVQIDSTSSVLSAYASSNASTPYLLFGANNLTYGFHELVLRNLGAKNNDKGGNQLLFDFLQTTAQLAPEGATVSNTTYQETDPALTFTGTWGSNKSPNFSGGGSSFTNQDQASMSLSFHGSAIYILGDKKNDHGLYSVTLDNKTAEVYDGVSGCGGAFAMTCEQQQPTLAYFASNLDDTLHTVKVVNMAGVNHSFFDLDSIVATVPSKYAPRQLASPPGSSVTSSATSSSTSPAKSSASTLSPVANPLLLLVLAVILLLRSNARR